MWRSVDLVWTDVSEERIASIFRVEKSLSLQPPAHPGSSLADFHTVSIIKTPKLLKWWEVKLSWNYG
jgi:hypothetical protein